MQAGSSPSTALFGRHSLRCCATRSTGQAPYLHSITPVTHGACLGEQNRPEYLTGDRPQTDMSGTVLVAIVHVQVQIQSVQC